MNIISKLFPKDKVAHCIVSDPRAPLKIGVRCDIKAMENGRWLVLRANGISFEGHDAVCLKTEHFFFV